MVGALKYVQKASLIKKGEKSAKELIGAGSKLCLSPGLAQPPSAPTATEPRKTRVKMPIAEPYWLAEMAITPPDSRREVEPS